MDSVIGLVGLQLEATDSEADMDDNSIYYFSGKNEAEACGLANELINSRILSVISSPACGIMP